MNTKTENTTHAIPPMHVRLSVGLVCTLTVFATGCAICCGPYDYHYPTFGGSVQRADPTWGRVGSIYSDPGPFGGPAADSNVLGKSSSSDQSGGLEEIEDGDSSLPTPENMLRNNAGESELPEPATQGSDVLPPPNRNLNQPNPDDSTSIRRLRNQSRRVNSRWR